MDERMEAEGGMDVALVKWDTTTVGDGMSSTGAPNDAIPLRCTVEKGRREIYHSARSTVGSQQLARVVR